MAEKTVLIKTKLGDLRGNIKNSILTGNSYYAFQGIPFGKPPLGDLRFKAPQPFGGWEGVRDALADGPMAKQKIMFQTPDMNSAKFWEGDEDCLYLNIYMNELPDNSRPKKPVMFSIHGGGFNGGTGGIKMAGPDTLLYGDVVIVTHNYRLNVFGFLSLENEDVPGNAGLKDQTLALKWVHDNIDSFGGDPNNVTIFGISAGGASVAYHLVSPSSRGLFNKGIMQSGFAFNPWAIQENPRSNALRLAKSLGCRSEDPQEVLQTLRSASSDDIIIAATKLPTDKDFMRTFGLIFVPCVETPGPDAFLTDSPENVMKKGDFAKVPIVLGCCVKEGALFGFVGLNEEKFAVVNENPSLLVPSFLGLKEGSVEEKEAEKEIWDYYFKGNPISWDNLSSYLYCMGDSGFHLGMEQTRKYLLEKSSESVYSYLFTNHSKCLCEIMKMKYDDPKEFAKIVTPSETCHAADGAFVYTKYSDIVPAPELTPAFKEAIIKQAKAWTSFAYKGDPNCSELQVIWKKSTKDDPCFMDIGTSWNMNQGIPLADRINFWEKLYSKYRSE
uniref:Carboxylic ester hydrolase n=1 Tax=Cuerna arida TaxID=1464854 RepID=A0A1B6FRB9_9HEMI